MKQCLKPFVAALMLCITGTAGHASDWRINAENLARAEPKIHEVMWSEDISFWITMDDNGADRSGYAGFVCLLLNEAGKPKGEFVSITVWDRASLLTDSPKQLGMAPCQ